MFVWLGSGRARKFNAGESGLLLDQAARAGLPVPAGAILLDAFYQIILSEGLVRPEGQVVWIDDADMFHNTLFHSVRLPRFKRPVALFPLLVHRGGTSIGPSYNNIDLNNPLQTARAFESAWGAGLDSQISKRYDVLILEMVDATYAGTADLIESQGEDRIKLKQSKTNEQWPPVEGEVITLERLKRLRRPDDSLPPFARRLQMLLRGLRRTFNKTDLHIEWADDGSVCWIIQIIPFDSTCSQVNG
jgi:hypothetical protein